MRLVRIAAAWTTASLLAGCVAHGGGFTPQAQPQGAHVIHYAPTLNAHRRFSGPLRPNSSYGVTYHGGPVEYSPKVYVVFWGGIWKTKKGDPDKVRPYLLAFLKALDGSQWTSTIAQYYGNYGYIQNDTAFGGAYIDSQSQLPPHPSDQPIAYEATLAEAHFGYDADASYIVAMPHGYNPVWFGLTYCAYHSYTTVFSGILAYQALPYMPDAGETCGAGSVNNPGTRDGVTIFEGHEVAETETDPVPFTGWYGMYQSEIADLCEFENLQNTKFGKRSFPTQPLWSDRDNACVQ
jgi:serine protease